MPLHAEDVMAVRQEMMNLLRQQMQVLNSGLELTDTQLRECYDRQGRVQQLREQLEASLASERNLAEQSSRVSAEVSQADYPAPAAIHAYPSLRENLAGL
jgi:predicted  nucleic acid-binding Zn-ribbon protein